MIKPETLERIKDAMRVEEVVSEFVSLRKRGANLLGLCPFHNEKTPSFTVHPVKGIFKCFGCGEGGNAIDFLIKHEQLNYIEAMRWLARKYNIEIVEEELSAEQQEVQAVREQMFNLNLFAEGYFREQLFVDEGTAVALSYCRERGITDESIEKFHIGYSPGGFDTFSKHAMSHGYTKELLVSSGLCIERDNGRLFDRFRERLIFPIHNLSGRVVGFGGRILKSDAKSAKYINSPETEIYQKSKVIYGIYQSRSTIASNDMAFLVEGYTDVIAMHQAGVTNVVASSGTALTTEQIRAIKRYTPNITIIYDGDTAGLKASFRGIDLILKEGMNVRVIPMPEGEDPDSFSRTRPTRAVLDYFAAKSENFITFKAELLKAEAAGDPVKMGGLIREIISSVALIPDALVRTLFVKQCAEVTEMEEEHLVHELNKQLRNLRIKNKEVSPEEIPEPKRTAPKQHDESQKVPLTEYQELDVIRLLINYGRHNIKTTDEQENAVTTTLAREIVQELDDDGITFDNPVWRKMYLPYSEAVRNNTEIPDENTFIHHPDDDVRQAAVNLLSSPYLLSKNWEGRHIIVPREEDLLEEAINDVLYSFRMRKVEAMMQKIHTALLVAESEAEKYNLMKEYHKLLIIRSQLAHHLGRTITF
jgi:DNA primase